MHCPNDHSELYDDLTGIYRCRKCPFNVPVNQHKMDQMYAWVSVDSQGLEGFIAVGSDSPMGPGGSMVTLVTPLIHSQEQEVMKMEKMARQAQQSTGVTIKLIKFESRTIVKELS